MAAPLTVSTMVFSTLKCPQKTQVTVAPVSNLIAPINRTTTPPLLLIPLKPLNQITLAALSMAPAHHRDKVPTTRIRAMHSQATRLRQVASKQQLFQVTR